MGHRVRSVMREVEPIPEHIVDIFEEDMRRLAPLSCADPKS